ncbi:hypothetical protein LEP1GSC058_2162 [Leptospira fainei serovar Hurstbridge str. BUT 6]|uniref:Uncharacterized protein n=1 Tax=Leptospira fainei serovar Hurstbridge str. BUT 6 TaxID=1193011 RepID=S3V2J3_9LEPT|nr:hypothetical protein LEP1GSC058_2162 [Leptospira fainei serovar Hurstbridge str. BUT 6]
MFNIIFYRLENRRLQFEYPCGAFLKKESERKSGGIFKCRLVIAEKFKRTHDTFTRIVQEFFCKP